MVLVVVDNCHDHACYYRDDYNNHCCHQHLLLCNYYIYHYCYMSSKSIHMFNDDNDDEEDEEKDEQE